MYLFQIKDVNYKGIVHYDDIKIKEGNFTFLCGESGSGKSTLLKLLNCVVSRDGGEILYKGFDIDSYNTINLRREVLMAAQNVFLFDGSILDNFKEFYGYRDEKMPTEDEIKKYLTLCLADFDLEQKTREMSGGERQRVFLAICLSFEPEVVLLDEPTSALDYKTSKALMANLKDYCKERGVSAIVVSHDLELADEFGDEIIRLMPKKGHETDKVDKVKEDEEIDNVGNSVIEEASEVEREDALSEK